MTATELTAIIKDAFRSYGYFPHTLEHINGCFTVDCGEDMWVGVEVNTIKTVDGAKAAVAAIRTSAHPLAVAIATYLASRDLLMPGAVCLDQEEAGEDDEAIRLWNERGAKQRRAN